MKVAHISDCYMPRLGGIEVQVTELSRRQAATGLDVTVFTATPGEQVRNGVEVLDGVTVNRVTARMPFDMPVHPRTTAHLVPLLEELEPDIVQVHLGVVSPFAWGGIRSAVRVGLPTLVTVHCVWGQAAKASYGFADHLVKWSESGVQLSAVSTVAAERIEAASDHPVTVLVVPNGVDPRDWNARGRHIPTPEQAAAAPVRFVAAMRLAPRKRATPLLRMFLAARELAAGREMTLHIAGDGPHRARLQRWIDSHGLADVVTLTGRLSRPDLQQLYLDSDVFIQPSIKESFGLAALEARATGLPIVARSQTGLTEFVNSGVEGLLADDDQGMAKAIARLAVDDELRIQMQRHNTDVPPEQVWSNVLETVSAAYGTAIDRLAQRTG
ncbi:MAG: glycosyltransferase family 4 protein [Actinobacteria bacterium]|nr:glycosyltransferase family 4 protein [Actinomycetota bacterium]